MEKKIDIGRLGEKNPMVDWALLKRYAELTRQLPNRPSPKGATFRLKRAFSERTLEFGQGRIHRTNPAR